jgi:hypothetical protein
MSDEPKKQSWMWPCAAVAFVLISAAVGYEGGLYHFCNQPGASDTGCALMTMVFVVPSTMVAAAFVVYVVARVISRPR